MWRHSNLSWTTVPAQPELPPRAYVLQGILPEVAHQSDRVSMNDFSTFVAGRLRPRRGEIEQAVYIRVTGVQGQIQIQDTEYTVGLQTAVEAVIDYALAGMEQGEGYSTPVPSTAIEQARRAARNGVGLETVLRRYIAGQLVFEDFVIQEAVDCAVVDNQGTALNAIRLIQAGLLDQIIVTITDAYTHESQRVRESPSERQSDAVRRLLLGQPIDPTHLGEYSLDTWHLALIAVGAGATNTVQSVARTFGCKLLSVLRGEETVWAWLGSREPTTSAEIQDLVERDEADDILLGIGEASKNAAGWRLSHQQAQVALNVTLHCPKRATRFGDVAFLEPWLRDGAMGRSLVSLYLSPLNDRSCSASILRETMRAYFNTNRNVTAAASRLNVSRRTIRNRLEVIENSLGDIFNDRQAELELALRLDEILTAPNP